MSEVEEVDDEDLPPLTIEDILERQRQDAYNEFWSDPCWTEPPGPFG